jgi:hypothetical protein
MTGSRTGFTKEKSAKTNKMLVAGVRLAVGQM